MPKAATPALPVPKPIISTAVTTTKNAPPKRVVPRIARGMSRFGLSDSSPRVDAASKPAKDRKPKTTPRNSADGAVPGGTEKTDMVNRCPAGALPISSRTSTTAVMVRISATVAPSTVSSTLVPRRTEAMVSQQASSRTTAVRMNGASVGGCGQAPTRCRKEIPKMPTTEEVVTP